MAEKARECRARVTALRALTPEVLEADLAMLAPATLAFDAGQWISVPFGPKTVRAYSIASSPRAPATLTLCADVAPGGPGSRWFRGLASGTEVGFKGRFSSFEGVSIDPKPVQKGGPPIWLGGRSDAALARAGRQGDGWMSYVVQPERYGQSVEKIRAAAGTAGRTLGGFEFAHLAFITLGRDWESAKAVWVAHLSKRYAQDFEPLARKYGIIGTPEQCAEQLTRFAAAGCTYMVFNVIGDAKDERDQLERIAADVLPRLR